MQEMPRAKYFLSSTTYAQLLTKTLPAMEAKWNEMGLRDGIHYVIGRKPPRHFDLPYQPPRKYENVVSFFNGYCREMLSLDRPDLARGGSYQGGDVDEAALVAKEHNDRVLLPSVRGFAHKFSSYWYGNVNYYTSIPWKPTGYWILDFEEKAKANPDMYAFVEANAYDNIEVLGLPYIQMLEAELPYLEFQVEVMNRRIRKVKDAFYHRFDPERHTYGIQYVYGSGPRGIEVSGHADPNYDINRLLELSFDFSGWFNCCTVWQEGRLDRIRVVEYCLRQLFVRQEDGKVAELVNKFCDQYQSHATKLVRVWGEPRGHDKTAISTETIYQTITRILRARGWQVDMRVPAGQVKAHKERSEYMNEVFWEGNPALPLVRFCQETCKDVIIAMQVTGIQGDFQKDKSREKDRAFPQEHAPHFTDTCDYYLMQKHGWKLAGRRRGALSATIR